MIPSQFESRSLHSECGSLEGSFIEGSGSIVNTGEHESHNDTGNITTQLSTTSHYSTEEKKKKKDEIRAIIAKMRGGQDDEDYEAYLLRSEVIKQSVAITDILLSGRLPFIVKDPSASTPSANRSKANALSTHGSTMGRSTDGDDRKSRKRITLAAASQSIAEGSLVSSNQSYQSTPSKSTTANNSVTNASLAKRPNVQRGPAISRTASMPQDMQSAHSASLLPPLSKAPSSRSFGSLGSNNKQSSAKHPPNIAISPTRRYMDYMDELLQEQAQTALSAGGLIDGSVPGGKVSSSKFHSLMTNFTKTLPKHDGKTADGKLQYVLEQLNKAKDDLNPSFIYFEAGIIFYEMNVYERAVVCLEKATKPSDAVRIIDTLHLPQDIHYHRKVERMSPFMLPAFLSNREELREKLIFEESERQRLRVQAAHCELTRMRCLVPEVRDLWKAHYHLEQAFRYIHGKEEQYELLLYFHKLLVTFTIEVLQEQTEFQRDQQIVRSSSGPLSDAHVIILSELEQYEPRNPVYQDWLGRRYTEKCLFEEAAFHYEQAREFRRKKPGREEVLQLWRKKPQESDEKAQEMAEMIHKNVHKSVLQTYQNYEGDIYDLARQEAQKDMSHFPGKRSDMCTVLYLPPPQGWTGQN